MRIEGASALVAGGASGPGRGDRAGAGTRPAPSVVIADLNAEKGEALAAELGERASFVEANVIEPEPVAGRGRRRRRGRGRPADLGLLRRDRLGRSGRPASRARTTSRSSTT